MIIAYSYNRRPGRSLAVGLFAALLWELCYQATEAGYLTWHLASIVVAIAGFLAIGYWLTSGLRVSIQQAQRESVLARASKA